MKKSFVLAGKNKIQWHFFCFGTNQNSPEINYYCKPLARQFDEVQCLKHKNWWFVVRNNFGIVLVFARTKNLPQDFILSS